MLTRHTGTEPASGNPLPVLLSDAEVRELAAMERICFPPHEAWSRAMIRQCLSLDGATLLRWYEDAGQGSMLAGFLIYHAHEAELLTVDVHPDWRRRGIARQLMRTAIDDLRALGHRCVTSQTAVENAPSIAMHETMGFSRVKRLPSYYGPGHDAWLLRLEMTPDSADKTPE